MTLIFTVILSEERGGLSGGPPPENFYIFEAPGLHFYGFWRFFANELDLN